MTAKDCIIGRRSIRKFKPNAIDHSVLEELVATASYAPSWKHTQITRYIAVEGSLKDQIAKEACDAYPHNGDIINSAPVLMVVSVIKNRSGFERDGSYSTPRKDGWQMYDAGVASQTFRLAAYDKGIGSVILGIFDSEKVASILGVPEDRDVIALIPIGYPDEAPVAPRRKPVEDLLSYK
ncbi:MAG: nitroreductase family protein [Lachnospiraceae bacterium]|nr:nitroreductase family protein [Lachnospiraceae bacterium]